MKPIEKVHFLNCCEVESLIKYFHSKKLKSEHKIKNNIIKHEEALINEYNNYESSIIEKYKSELDIFEFEHDLWLKKKCICGNKLFFINAYEFWGCPDYQNLSLVKKHTTFKKDEDFFFSSRYKNLKIRLPDIHWCTTILKNLNLKGRIKPKELFFFYQAKGFDDLREKYGNKSSINNFNTFSIVNNNSKEDEIKIKSHLENYFNRVLYQQYISYNYCNSKTDYCIPDLIVSDSENVFIIEVKRTDYDINPQQLELYYSIIKHEMNRFNNTRNLISLFIINKKLSNSKLKYITIEQLLNQKSKKDLINLFKEKKYIFYKKPSI